MAAQAKVDNGSKASSRSSVPTRAQVDQATDVALRRLAELGIQMEIKSDPAIQRMSYSFSCPKDLPSFVRDHAISELLEATSMSHRLHGGSGLGLSAGNGKTLPLSLATAKVISQRLGVDLNKADSGIRELKSPGFDCSIVYVASDSPLREEAFQRTPFTRLGGLFGRVYAQTQGVSGKTVHAEKNIVLAPRPSEFSSFSKIKFGSMLRHEIAHLLGADEFLARVEEREYERRFGLVGPSDHQIFLGVFSVSIVEWLLRKGLTYSREEINATANAAWNEGPKDLGWFELSLRALSVIVREGFYSKVKDYQRNYIPRRRDSIYS